MTSLLHGLYRRRRARIPIELPRLGRRVHRRAARGLRARPDARQHRPRGSGLPAHRPVRPVACPDGRPGRVRRLTDSATRRRCGALPAARDGPPLGSGPAVLTLRARAGTGRRRIEGSVGRAGAPSPFGEPGVVGALELDEAVRDRAHRRHRLAERHQAAPRARHRRGAAPAQRHPRRSSLVV